MSDEARRLVEAMLGAVAVARLPLQSDTLIIKFAGWGCAEDADKAIRAIINLPPQPAPKRTPDEEAMLR